MRDVPFIHPALFTSYSKFIYTYSLFHGSCNDVHLIFTHALCQDDFVQGWSLIVQKHFEVLLSSIWDVLVCIGHLHGHIFFWIEDIVNCHVRCNCLFPKSSIKIKPVVMCCEGLNSGYDEGLWGREEKSITYFLFHLPFSRHLFRTLTTRGRCNSSHA